MLLRWKLLCRKGKRYLENGEEEPTPYYPVFPSLPVWEMTFWEYRRRRKLEVPNHLFKLLGVEQGWWGFITGTNEEALRNIWVQVKPGDSMDFKLYRRILRKAFLWGYLKKGLQTGGLNHKRLKAIYKSADMVYPKMFDKVKRETR